MINAQTDANHVYITISGFFSENTDKKEHWKGVAKHFEFGQKEIFDSNASIFSLTWESKTNNDLYKAIVGAASTVAIQGMMQYASGPLSKLGVAALLSEGMLGEI